MKEFRIGTEEIEGNTRYRIYDDGFFVGNYSWEELLRLRDLLSTFLAKSASKINV